MLHLYIYIYDNNDSDHYNNYCYYYNISRCSTPYNSCSAVVPPSSSIAPCEPERGTEPGRAPGRWVHHSTWPASKQHNRTTTQLWEQVGAHENNVRRYDQQTLVIMSSTIMLVTTYWYGRLPWTAMIWILFHTILVYCYIQAIITRDYYQEDLFIYSSPYPIGMTHLGLVMVVK